MLEKSGVGEVLRCELAEEGQDVLADEYPDEYVQLADVDQEFTLCQVELDRSLSLSDSSRSIVVRFSQTRDG